MSFDLGGSFPTTQLPFHIRVKVVQIKYTCGVNKKTENERRKNEKKKKKDIRVKKNNDPEELKQDLAAKDDFVPNLV